jgi:serine/threonine protein kinase/Flp pilus assembly protein TadD
MSEQQGAPEEWSIAGPPPAGDAPRSFADWGSLKREVLGEVLAPSAELLEELASSSGQQGRLTVPDISSILMEDYRQRLERRSGPTASSGELISVDKSSLESILHDVGYLRSNADEASKVSTSRFPELGECLFGFRLRRELGHGAFAHVFLAEQLDLAARSVVLKVSKIEGSEPQTLAQLQHTHIVPIFSLHEDAASRLRAVCMPYFGGATLGQVLQALSEATSRPRRGQELLDALDAVATHPPQPQPSQATGDQVPRAILDRLGYIESVIWIGARLAEGLYHAHQRGILHRDIKPQNILLGADAQPMLLDFNLAHDEHNPSTDSNLGGTVSYMSPEHLRAVAGRDPALARKVDGRSDIYSLGLVLFEMLASRRPFACSIGSHPAAFYLESMAIERSRAAPSLRHVRGDVPWGLNSILRRCLAPEPEHRYRTAEELAEDLRRLLANEPLRYAPEPSIAERFQKWQRRHPRLATSCIVGLASVLLLSVLSLVLFGTWALLADTKEQLGAAQAEDRHRRYEAGVTEALFLVNTTSDLADHLQAGIKACEVTLETYHVLDRTTWQEPADWSRLDEEKRRELAGEARDLLLLLAGARVRQAPPGNHEALQAGLRLVDQAESIPGLPPSRALWEDRAAYLEGLGERGPAEEARAKAAQIEPATAQEHYLVAMSYARRGKYDTAIGYLNKAVELQPRHYWSFAQRGLCRLERGELELAASDLSVCIGLWPDFAWGHLNRAGVLARCGKRAAAIADYDAALRCDPKLVTVYLNRGLLHLEEEHYTQALADFQEARAHGRDDAFLHSGLGVALERLGRHMAADEELRQANARAAALKPGERARLRWVHGFAVARRKPAEARGAFEEVLRDSPKHPQALYGLGMLLEQAGKGMEALPYYHRALVASPTFVAPRRARAVVLARLGECDRAAQEINQCLALDPNSGVTVYAAACVTALVAQQTTGAQRREVTDQAIHLLGEAFRQQYGQDKAAKDRDLDGVRGDPRFQELLARCSTCRPDRARTEQR